MTVQVMAMLGLAAVSAIVNLVATAAVLKLRAALLEMRDAIRKECGDTYVRQDLAEMREKLVDERFARLENARHRA